MARVSISAAVEQASNYPEVVGSNPTDGCILLPFVCASRRVQKKFA